VDAWTKETGRQWKRMQEGLDIILSLPRPEDVAVGCQSPERRRLVCERGRRAIDWLSKLLANLEGGEGQHPELAISVEGGDHQKGDGGIRHEYGGAGETGPRLSPVADQDVGAPLR
jgi:hypothetical protein